MLGTCMYCNQKKLVNDDDVEEFAQVHIVSKEAAADSVAARECNCDRARLERQREDTIQLATDYINNLFEESPKSKEMALTGINAVVSMAVDKVTFKKGKKTYSLFLDALGCLKLKINFTDKEEVKF